MTQGSQLTTRHTADIVELATRRRQALFVEVKKNAALVFGIEQIALRCQEENAVTVEHMEHIQYLAQQLGEQLNRICLELAEPAD